MKLTQSSISRLALSAGKTDEIFFDEEITGFGVRVRAGGSRKFVVHYRQGGVQRRHTLGAVGVMHLEEARKKARKILVAVDDGKDPAAEKATRRAAAGLTFERVMEDYLETRQLEMKSRSFEETARHLKRHCKPLHKLAIASLTRQVIASRLRDISQNQGPVAGNRVRSSLSAMFGWAIGEGFCDVNPVTGTNRAVENEERERALNDDEVARLWNGLPDTQYGRIVRLLLLTGCRRDEIGSLLWSEINESARTITLPGIRTKNGREHVVPLTEPALQVLRQCPKVPERDFVFGEGSGGYSGWSRAKARLGKQMPLKAWALHDLRRTIRTNLGGLGVLPHISEAVLNHLPPKLVRTYDKNKYEAEKRDALQRWADHIRLIVAQANGDNVVRIGSAKP
jgi:integrase